MSFDYDLPSELIALSPSPERTAARMLVYEKAEGHAHHVHVKNILDYLKTGDLLIMNQARVDPARLHWTWKDKQEEVLFLKCTRSGETYSEWEAIVSGKKIHLASPLKLSDDVSFEILAREENTIAKIKVHASELVVRALMHQKGLPPIPPYIRKQRERALMDYAHDEERYQTVFATESGAVAAPTAGLHFTPELIKAIKAKGASLEFVYLQVGWGTFEPLTPKHWETGKLHEEYVKVPSSVAQKILEAKKNNQRVIAVGTTSVRAVEWWYQHGAKESGYEGVCDLFLRPPWQSEVLSGMLTNFHLSGSSLLTLVSAFLGPNGPETLKKLYEKAVEEKYRFYSYGDCMLIL